MHFTRALTLLPLMLAACGGDDETLEAWRGGDPHVRLTGEIDGTPIDVELDAAAAADLTRSLCKREYDVPDAADPATWSSGTLPELEATVKVTQDGLEKELELGFTATDFAAIAAGTSLALVPAVEEQLPAAGQAYLEVEWKWEDGDQFVNYEGSAESGTLAFELLDGSRGADGVVVPDGTGRLGLFFDAAWPMGGHLAGSLTVGCGANEVE